MGENSLGKNRLCFPRNNLGLYDICHVFKNFLNFRISSKRADHQFQKSSEYFYPESCLSCKLSPRHTQPGTSHRTCARKLPLIF